MATLSRPRPSRCRSSGLDVPTALPGVDPSILDPRKTYADESLWQEKAQDLAQRFIDNFAKYTVTPAGEKLVNAGPKR